MMRATIAWALFIAGWIFVAAAVVRMQIDGLFLVGVIALFAWLGLVGGFRAGFYIVDRETSRALDHMDQQLDAQEACR